jgi:hypothetical protein
MARGTPRWCSAPAWSNPGGSYRGLLVTGQARDINGGLGGVTNHPRRSPAWTCRARGRVPRPVPRTSALDTWPLAPLPGPWRRRAALSSPCVTHVPGLFCYLCPRPSTITATSGARRDTWFNRYVDMAIHDAAFVQVVGHRYLPARHNDCVSMRYGCNPRLRNAFYHWARTSVQNDEKARLARGRFMDLAHDRPTEGRVGRRVHRSRMAIMA